MNTKDFVKALRSVIREEVRSAVREELKSILTESKTARPVQKSTVRYNTQTPVKKYTGNSILDQVLNETKLTSDFKNQSNVGYDSDYQDFGSFSTNNVTSQETPTSIMDMDIVDDYESPLPQMDPTMPFMKDYSQLMKKADQISAQKQF